jgi:hypothetical protein
MGNRLYNRVAKLTLARPQQSGGFFDFFKLSGNAIEITGLRIAFEITKTLEKNANDARIEIGNLSEATRNEFTRLPLHVRLDAGHDGEPQLLFKGDLHWSDSVPREENWITTLECKDGGRAIKEARISRTYKPGVSSKTVLNDLIAAHGVKLPTSIADAKEFAKQYASGVTVSGPASTEMSRLLSRHGMSWSFQNGKIQILRKNDVRADEALVISRDTGMINSPEYGAPKKDGGKPVLTVQTILYPRVIPGIKISVTSEKITGVFKVQRVHHSGDTHGDAWMSDIEAVKI